MKIRFILSVITVSLALPMGAATERIELSPDETRAIAKEAYIYGYPLVDNYRVLYTYAVNKSSPEYKGPFNEIVHNSRLATAEDKTVQTPNSDTPYSFLIYDLRAEPLVLTLPPVEKGRYFSVQFIDLYTFNYDYLGTRTTGNGGGVYLLAGAGWKGEPPKGISQVIRSETDIGLVLYRTQLFNPEDLEKVKAIQAGYKVQTLSAYTGKAAARIALPIEYMEPLSRTEQRTDPQFFNELSFALQFCPLNPSEKDLRARIEKIGVRAGNRINLPVLEFQSRVALADGMADGQKAILSQIAATTSSANFFGTRDFLKNNYLALATGAQIGIYGNSKEEAVYIPFDKDFDNLPLDGKKHYILRFTPGQLPPVNAFWSLTMYELPSRLLVTNSLNRYLINSSTMPD